MGWSKAQVKLFVKQVRQEVGAGWDYLGQPVREALIAQKAFTVSRLQSSETVRVDAMDALLNAMETEAGLRPPEETTEQPANGTADRGIGGIFELDEVCVIADALTQLVENTDGDELEGSAKVSFEIATDLMDEFNQVIVRAGE